MRVLVVDDNATNRKVLTGQLAAVRHRSRSAVANADEALAALERAHASGQPFEVALLDHHMPDCDGADLGRRIVERPDSSTPRGWCCSPPRASAATAQRFAELGFAGYLLKPVTQRDLIDCLHARHVGERGGVAHGERSRSSRATRFAPAALREGRTRILLAEDNPVNQKVARARAGENSAFASTSSATAARPSPPGKAAATT